MSNPGQSWSVGVATAILALSWGFSSGCHRVTSDGATSSASASPSAAPSGGQADGAPDPSPEVDFGKNSVAKTMPTDRPMLGVTSFTAIVYKEPRDTSKRIGYLRLGTKVPRGETPASTKGGCPGDEDGGWYEISPVGFVCVGKDATLDMENPILRASAKRPNTAAPLPYRYGFVRAVLPLYLKAPLAEEQEKSEFKLKEHLEWYEQNKAEVDKVKLGAWDVPVDHRGVPIKGRELGDLGQGQTSLELGLGRHFGGETDADPIPEWLQGGKRSIPNVSDFEVPESAIFADRARRFTGLSLIGSFALGEDGLNRRFAITTDLRLAPTSKLKPDTGSPWHGVELRDTDELPFAFVREEGAMRMQASGGTATRGEELPYRGVIPLTGKQKRIGDERYYAARDGSFVRASDVGLVVTPSAFPSVADQGEKWIEVSLSEQTLVLWEGKRPVYATLVSTGRKEYPTVTGEFRIRNKHITATMDSNEGSDVGGGPRVAVKSDGASSEKKSTSKVSSGQAKTTVAKGSDKTKAPTKPAKGTKDKPAPKAPATGAKIPKKGDGEYGVTKRRGEGTYALKDVPYIQYFAAGFALHAAYWHDVFGKKRSHGCVNLSPIDAHRVFMWTEPAIPEGWHSINTGEEFGEGTTVIVHE